MRSEDKSSLSAAEHSMTFVLQSEPKTDGRDLSITLEVTGDLEARSFDHTIIQ